jgi:hypothetical protein
MMVDLVRRSVVLALNVTRKGYTAAVVDSTGRHLGYRYNVQLFKGMHQ